MQPKLREAKRTSILALLALACLTALPSIAHARYVDGMNVYEYVRSSPATHVDPDGAAASTAAAESLQLDSMFGEGYYDEVFRDLDDRHWSAPTELSSLLRGKKTKCPPMLYLPDELDAALEVARGRAAKTGREWGGVATVSSTGESRVWGPIEGRRGSVFNTAASSSRDEKGAMLTDMGRYHVHPDSTSFSWRDWNNFITGSAIEFSVVAACDKRFTWAMVKLSGKDTGTKERTTELYRAEALVPGSRVEVVDVHLSKEQREQRESEQLEAFRKKQEASITANARLYRFCFYRRRGMYGSLGLINKREVAK